jgi:predicted Zn-dependent peptidase
MRIGRAIKILLVVAIVAVVGCGEGELTRSKLKKLQRETLPPFTPPQVQVIDLKNGAKIFLLEDHELPIINMKVIVKAGSIYENQDELGVAALTGMLLRDGGTEKRTPDEVDSTIDDTAARISFSSGKEMMQGHLKTLTHELDKTLPLFFEMVSRPRFDEKRFALNQQKLMNRLKREKDDPDTVAIRGFRKLIYGDPSPWARFPEPEDIAKLEKKDVHEFWKNYVRPNNILISVAGDFNKDNLVKRIEKELDGASNEEVKFPPVAEVKLQFKPGFEDIKRDLTQSFIYMGHLGIKRHNPDKFALQVMNEVLGGGSFKSRLVEDIRSNKGLAYSVWSHFGWGTDYGMFRVYAATKAEQAKEVIKLIREQVTDLADTGKVTRKEFDFAKEAEVNRLIFEFDDSFKITNARAYYHFYGYPPNYWEIYRDSIQKVTRDDIKRVARKYLHPDALRVLVVGP